MRSDAVEPASTTTTSTFHLSLPTHWPEQTDILSLCQQMGPLPSTLLVGLGVVYLLMGFYWHKALVMFNAIGIGAILGLVIGQKFGNPWVGGFMGAFLAAAITWPQMKYAVSVMGALVGAVIGAGVWQSFQLDLKFVWAGAMMGLIFMGMLSFILFRGSIMMYTSFQGSVMLVFGLLGLILKYEQVGTPLAGQMMSQHFLLPLCIFVPALAGVLYQQANHPAPAGGGGGGEKK